MFWVKYKVFLGNLIWIISGFILARFWAGKCSTIGYQLTSSINLSSSSTSPDRTQLSKMRFVLKTGNTKWRGGSVQMTSSLRQLVLRKRLRNIFSLKSSWFEAVCTRRSTVLRFPIQTKKQTNSNERPYLALTYSPTPLLAWKDELILAMFFIISLALSRLIYLPWPTKMILICCDAQGGQGMYNSDCRVSLLPELSP